MKFSIREKVRPRNAGFTLLELLLAITLLSLITAAITGGIHLGRRTWEAGRASESIDEIEDAARSIRKLLSNTFLVRVVSASAKPTDPAVAVFKGNESNCRFVSLSQGYSNWGGLLLTEIGVQPIETDEDIDVWTNVFRSDSINMPREAMRRTSLLRGVQNFRFSYFGSLASGQPPVWSAVWPEQAGLPLLVSFTLVARRQGKLFETSATVAIPQ